VNRPFAAVRHIAKLAALTMLGSVVACIHRTTPFDEYFEREQWTQAAREFSQDSSLRRNDRTLYRAALVFGTPGRPTYKPDSARALLTTLLARFPGTSHRDDAIASLALLDHLANMQRANETRVKELDARIEALNRETRELRARIDSSGSQSDSLRAAIKVLETERKEREEQVKALRLELQQLKEIDLKRLPARPIKPA
jgi:hypothetical protein